MLIILREVAMMLWITFLISNITIAHALMPCAIGEPPVSRAQMLADVSYFSAEVYAKRPQGWSFATKFNMGGTGFMHQFYLWSLVRALKPKHIIESGAYNGLGTWQLRKAAPDAQIIVLSPKTPHIYVDQHNDSRYFTDEQFRDFSSINWTCVDGLDRASTIVFIDDHQSGYRRMLEAHARGFHHLIFDDNMPGPRSDHFSVKSACAASKGEFDGLEEWDDFRGIKVDWGRWQHGQFNVTKQQLRMVGISFLRAVNVYAEMPPLWSEGLSWSGWQPPLMSNEEANNFVDKHKEQLRGFHREAVSYQGFLYVRTQPWHQSKPRTLYYPEHVTANGYTGILPRKLADCDQLRGGFAPGLLKTTKIDDDWKRNHGAGVSRLVFDV